LGAERGFQEGAFLAELVLEDDAAEDDGDGGSELADEAEGRRGEGDVVAFYVGLDGDEGGLVSWLVGVFKYITRRFLTWKLGPTPIPAMNWKMIILGQFAWSSKSMNRPKPSVMKTKPNQIGGLYLPTFLMKIPTPIAPADSDSTRGNK
jgi:hypothetical protein